MIKLIDRNTVPSENQLGKCNPVFFYGCANGTRVLFVGNSITKHAPKEEIGWFGDWGMAASEAENDYAHIIASSLSDEYGEICWCIAQVAEWERNYTDSTVLSHLYQSARDFEAEIVIVRLGENVERKDFDYSAFKQSFKHLITFFAVCPSAKVVVTSLFWQSEEVDTILRQTALEMGCLFVPIGDLGQMYEMKALGLFSHEGVAMHPNDLGMQKIAERIINELKGRDL